MFLKNEDVKIGTIPDANGSDNPLKKMEFLTEKEMKDSSRLFGKVIVPPGSALAYHTHEGEGEAYHILQGKGLYNDNGTKYEVHPGDTTFTCDAAGHHHHTRWKRTWPCKYRRDRSCIYGTNLT